MAKPAKKSEPTPKDNESLICQNRRARHEYEVLDTLECGMVLVGSEVKSLRNGKIMLDDAHGYLRQGELWLHGCEIPEYKQANQFNHEPKRPRKLLLHRREVKKWATKAHEKGFTLIPLKMYFKQGRAKVLMGLCKGRQLHDKREKLKKETMKRDMDRIKRGRGRD